MMETKPVLSPPRVFTYYRVSTNKQADKETYQSQKMAVEAFITSLGYEIADEFYDPAISGSHEQRPKLLEMLSRLGEIDGIAVFSRSRITRNLFFGSEFDKLLFENNVMLIIAETKEVIRWDQVEDPEDLRILNEVKDYANAKQRKGIGRALQAGRERAKRDGVIFGRPPTLIRWKKVRAALNVGMKKAQIIRMLGTTPNTFYNRLRAHYHELRAKGITQATIGKRYYLKQELMDKWETQKPEQTEDSVSKSESEKQSEPDEIDELFEDLGIDPNWGPDDIGDDLDGDQKS